MAGCVIISNAAIHYKIWIALILGMIGGVIYVASSLIAKKSKLDDPLHIFQAHGIPAFVAIILVVFFHQDEGIFFTDIHEIINTQQGTARVILLFGANILGAIIVIVWTALLTAPFYAILKKCLLRVTKVQEIIGLDVT